MTVGDILEIPKGAVRCKIEHQVDPTLLRPSDVMLEVPDTSKFWAATGWRPEIPIEVTLQDLLDYHRGRFKETRQALA